MKEKIKMILRDGLIKLEFAIIGLLLITIIIFASSCGGGGVNPDLKEKSVNEYMEEELDIDPLHDIERLGIVGGRFFVFKIKVDSMTYIVADGSGTALLDKYKTPKND